MNMTFKGYFALPVFILLR